MSILHRVLIIKEENTETTKTFLHKIYFEDLIKMNDNSDEVKKKGWKKMFYKVLNRRIKMVRQKIINFFYC